MCVYANCVLCLLSMSEAKWLHTDLEKMCLSAEGQPPLRNVWMSRLCHQT